MYLVLCILNNPLYFQSRIIIIILLIIINIIIIINITIIIVIIIIYRLNLNIFRTSFTEFIILISYYYIKYENSDKL